MWERGRGEVAAGGWKVNGVGEGQILSFKSVERPPSLSKRRINGRQSAKKFFLISYFMMKF